MWFAGFGLLGRISGTGQITGWDDTSSSYVGFPDALAVGPDGEIWYTNASKINRVTPSGAFASTNIPGGAGGLQMLGIATGPDGALWFTEMPWGSGSDSIGRLTIDGHYTRWLLPKLRSDPMRITAGPDGAMWFTERAGYRIGRITTHGRISEFPLPPGTSPFDITSGHDGVLWFTTYTSIGRITTSGHITLWPVKNAKNLVGIAAALDGSFWLAGGPTDTVWHFVPR
jgi:virginiamycin B lyase